MIRQTRYYSERPLLEKKWEEHRLSLRRVEEEILKSERIVDYPSEVDHIEEEVSTAYLWDRDLTITGRVAAQLVVPEGFSGRLSLTLEDAYAWLKVVVPSTSHVDVVLAEKGTFYTTVEWFVKGRLNITASLLSEGIGELRSILNLYRGSVGLERVMGMPKGHSLRMFSQLNHIESSQGRSISKALVRDGRVSMEGLIKIYPKADTDSYLEQHALLLSEKGLVYQYPSLEIAHNNVKASHSASSFYVDEEDLFYLQSRGLTYEEALSLVVSGFMEGFAFPVVL